MEKGKSLSVGLLMELAEGRRQGLTHEENARLHGVAYSTSKYAQRWCEKMRRTAEAYLKTQSLRSIRTYRSELSLDVAESLSLQEGCASHGWPPPRQVQDAGVRMPLGSAGAAGAGAVGTRPGGS